MEETLCAGNVLSLCSQHLAADGRLFKLCAVLTYEHWMAVVYLCSLSHQRLHCEVVMLSL